MSVWRSLSALAVLIATISISLIAASAAQAASRQGSHGGRAYGGHGGSMQVARLAVVRAPVQVMRAHPAIAYTSRPYNVASYAPRAYHGHAGYPGGYAAARVVHYAAPVHHVRQAHQANKARYVHYQPTAYHQATYATVRRSCTPRPHCVC
jgi:hypothetical protein